MLGASSTAHQYDDPGAPFPCRQSPLALAMSPAGSVMIARVRSISTTSKISVFCGSSVATSACAAQHERTHACSAYPRGLGMFSIGLGTARGSSLQPRNRPENQTTTTARQDDFAAACLKDTTLTAFQSQRPRRFGIGVLDRLRLIQNYCATHVPPASDRVPSNGCCQHEIVIFDMRNRSLRVGPCSQHAQ